MANYVSLEKIALFLDKVKLLIPAKVSQLENDTNFITNTVTNLANYYTKTESYTKTEVNTLISQIKTIQIEVVDSLPVSGSPNTIYLVKEAGKESTNKCIEYIWVAAESRFEPIGTTEVDLSNCWMKSELTEVTNEEINGLFA